MIEGVIHFILGERWHGWPVEAIEPVELEAGEEGRWYITTHPLEMLSVEATLMKPASKPGLTFALERCHWEGTRSQRVREWLSRRFRSLTPWDLITRVAIDAADIHPVKHKLPTPMTLTPGDCLRVRVEEVGDEYHGAGLQVMIHVRYEMDSYMSR